MTRKSKKIQACTRFEPLTRSTCCWCSTLNCIAEIKIKGSNNYVKFIIIISVTKCDTIMWLTIFCFNNTRLFLSIWIIFNSSYGDKEGFLSSLVLSLACKVWTRKKKKFYCYILETQCDATLYFRISVFTSNLSWSTIIKFPASKNKTKNKCSTVGWN